MSEVVRQTLTGTVLPGVATVLLGAAAMLAREYIKHLKNARLQQMLLALVQAAEQIYGAGKGEAKRRYVREKSKAKGLAPTREDVEAAVYTMTQGQQTPAANKSA